MNEEEKLNRKMSKLNEKENAAKQLLKNVEQEKYEIRKQLNMIVQMRNSKDRSNIDKFTGANIH